MFSDNIEQMDDLLDDQALESNLRHKFSGSLDNEHAITLCLSFDEVPVNDQYSGKATPVACIMLNLHPSVGTKQVNILPLAIVPGPAEPANMNTFLRPFLEEITRLSDAGVQCYDADLDKWYTLRVHLVLCMADTPAMSKMIHFSGYVAIRGCRFCYVNGFNLPVGTYYPS